MDENDFGEVTITDFVESSQSVFEQLLADRDSLEVRINNNDAVIMRKKHTHPRGAQGANKKKVITNNVS